MEDNNKPHDACHCDTPSSCEKNTQQPQSNKKRKKTFIVISGDGGGIKGIVPLTVLKEIAEATGTHLNDYAFAVTGCSTSSIALAGCIAPHDEKPQQPAFTEKDIRRFYFHNGPIIFPYAKQDWSDQQRSFIEGEKLRTKFNKYFNMLRRGNLYPIRNLRVVLETQFQDKKADDAIKPFFFPTTSFLENEAIWFTNVQEVAEKYPHVYWVPHMSLAQITEFCARPNVLYPFEEHTFTYFEKDETGEIVQREKTIIPTDGTYFAGSPEVEAYEFTKSMLSTQGYEEDEYRIVMLSLGTGKRKISHSIDDLNGKKHGFWSRHFGILGFFNSLSNTVEVALTQQFRARRGILKENMNRNGDLYFRFEGEIDTDKHDHPTSNLTNTTGENMNRLVEFAKNVMIGENRDDFETFIEVVKRSLADEPIEDIAKQRLKHYYHPLYEAPDPLPQEASAQEQSGWFSRWFSFGPQDKKDPQAANDENRHPQQPEKCPHNHHYRRTPHCRNC